MNGRILFHITIALVIVPVVLAVSGCRSSAQDDPRQQAREALIKRQIPFSEDSFIESAKNGDAVAVRLFLQAGVNVHAKDQDGWTALMYAAFGGYDEIVKTLVESGANVNEKSNDGYTAMMGAALKDRLSTVRLLLECGADANAQDKDGFTALMYADAKGHTDVIEVLLGVGAKVTHGHIHSMPERKF